MELSDERKSELLDLVAREIKRRRMEAPAIMFLEMHKPLSFLAGSALHLLSPLLELGFRRSDIQDVGNLLEDRNNVEELIRRIEHDPP